MFNRYQYSFVALIDPILIIPYFFFLTIFKEQVTKSLSQVIGII